jgi:hypothetical protein
MIEPVEPSFVLEYGNGQKIIGTRANASIFRFFGSLSMYDHIFIVIHADEKKGVYLFRHQPGYDKIADYMMDHDYPAFVNMRKVAECDIKAFDEVVSSDADDTESGVPGDW